MDQPWIPTRVGEKRPFKNRPRPRRVNRSRSRPENHTIRAAPHAATIDSVSKTLPLPYHRAPAGSYTMRRKMPKCSSSPEQAIPHCVYQPQLCIPLRSLRLCGERLNRNCGFQIHGSVKQTGSGAVQPGGVQAGFQPDIPPNAPRSSHVISPPLPGFRPQMLKSSARSQTRSKRKCCNPTPGSVCFPPEPYPRPVRQNGTTP